MLQRLAPDYLNESWLSVPITFTVELCTWMHRGDDHWLRLFRDANLLIQKRFQIATRWNLSVLERRDQETVHWSVCSSKAGMIWTEVVVVMYMPRKKGLEYTIFAPASLEVVWTTSLERVCYKSCVACYIFLCGLCNRYGSLKRVELSGKCE